MKHNVDTDSEKLDECTHPFITEFGSTVAGKYESYDPAAVSEQHTVPVYVTGFLTSKLEASKKSPPRFISFNMIPTIP